MYKSTAVDGLDLFPYADGSVRITLNGESYLLSRDQANLALRFLLRLANVEIMPDEDCADA